LSNNLTIISNFIPIFYSKEFTDLLQRAMAMKGIDRKNILNFVKVK